MRFSGRHDRPVSFAASLLALGLAGPPFASPSLGAPSTPIPPSFFGMSTVKANDAPKVSIGTLGHGLLAWHWIERTKGVYDFTTFDKYLADAAKLGLVDPATNVANVAVTLGMTPGWAVADQSSCTSPNGPVQCTAAPDDLSDWTDFVTALVAHYDGTAQPHIRIYELWNEMNARNFWTGTDAQMVALARAAYPIVHRDPYSLLLTPSVAGPVGTASSTSAFNRMTSYLQAGGSRWADGGAFHGYAAQTGVRPFPMPEDDATAGCTPFVSCFGSVVTKATQMRAVFDQNGLAGRPMFQTEGSWGNGNVTDPDAQVAWLARWAILQASLRSSLNLELASWYTWGGGATQTWGSIEDASLEPTAAGVAWDQLYRWLVGATLDEPCSGTGDGTYTCRLTRPGGYVGRVLWNTKGPLAVAPGSGFTKVRDLAGKTTSLPPGGTVTIGAKPLLVEGSSLAPPGAPNIVLVLTDDQDVQLGSLDAMPRVRELLTDRGTLFSNSYVPLSLCCPSRTTLLRGQFPHNTGVMTNALPLGGFERVWEENLEASTVATLLQGAGYRTVLLGKYLNGYPDLATPTYVPPGWDEWYSPSAGNPYSEFNYTLNENGLLRAYKAAEADYMTDVNAGKVVDFIQRARATPDRPLFVYLATYAPHSPYTPAPRHAGLFPGIAAPRPPSFNEADVSGKPDYIRSKPLLTDADVATIDGSYRKRLQALQSVDEAVARIVEALAAAGRLENTYFVFTSDNGYHMGEHRLTSGKYTPYETDLHVPLVIRGPGVSAGVVRDELVANVDLAETFADLAGVPALDFSDGRSLKPLFAADRPAAWRKALLLEEFNGGIPEVSDDPAFGFPTEAESVDPAAPAGLREPPDAADLAALAAHPIPTYFGFQAPGYKYVEYETGERELYVAADPYELTNVVAQVDPAILASLSSYLRTLKGCRAEACRTADAVAPPPLLTASFTVSPDPAPSGASVTLAATAAGTPPYAFAWNVDGVPRGGATATLGLSDGIHAVTLRATDAIEAEAVATRSVTVGAPPAVAILTPSSDVTVEAGLPVPFQAAGSPSVGGGSMTFAWDFGDESPAVVGAAVSRPFGAPGTYVVTLTGTDSRGSTATATRTVTVTRPTATGASLVLPVVLEASGANGSFYTSDVTIASRLPSPVDVLFTYTASAGSGSGYARLTLAPGQQQLLPGFLAWLRDRGLPIPAAGGPRIGTLQATFLGAGSTSGLFLGSRTFTADPAGGPGTFGLFSLSAPPASGSLTVFGLQQNAAQRSNLALVNTSGAPIALRTRLLGPAGETLSILDTGLGPWGWTQWNTPLAGTGASSGVAVVSLVSGTGTFSAYGVLNDAVTSDGSFLPPLVPDSSAPDRLVPIVLSVGGYASELTLANLTSSPLALTLTYTASPQLGSGAGSGTAVVTLAPNEQRVAPDALAFLRQLGVPVAASGDAGGSLDARASTGDASSFAAGARTFVRGPGGGTYGVFYAGLTLAESATSVAWIQGLRQDALQRSNLAVVNRGDAPDAITLRITFFGPDGVQAGLPETRTLAPGEWAQYDRPLESRGVASGSARIEKLSGASRFVAYGVLNDQGSSDGSYVPMSP